MQDNQPGWVFRPGDNTDTQTSPPASAEVDNFPVQPSEVPTQVYVEATADNIPQQAPANPEQPHVEWTASEYIASPKSGGWFFLLGLGSLGVAVVTYFVTKGDLVSTGVVVILGIMLGIFAARQPQVLRYAINSSGIYVGDKFYPYETFKSFSVVKDNAMGYISLMPLRRFMPPLTIHYDPSDEERAADTLAEYLPYEVHKPDIVDSLTKKFRF